MGEPARQRKSKGRDEGSKDVPTVSLRELREKVQHQPFDQKLFTWAALVFVGASTLPWTEGGANGWSSSGVLFVSLSIAIALLVHVLGLEGIGPARGSRRRGFWKLYRWVAAVQLFVFGIYVATQIPQLGSWGLGLLLCAMAFAVHGTALYRILEREELLPLRIER